MVIAVGEQILLTEKNSRKVHSDQNIERRTRPHIFKGKKSMKFLPVDTLRRTGGAHGPLDTVDVRPSSQEGSVATWMPYRHAASYL